MQRYLSNGSEQLRNSILTTWWPLMKAKSSALFFFFLCLFAGVFVTTRFIDSPIATGNKLIQAAKSAFHKHPKNLPKIPLPKVEYPLNCTPVENQTRTSCPTNYPTNFDFTDPDLSSCPDYFRYIHEDLRPWKVTGITRDMLARAQRTSNFRLVILNGKAYVEKYSNAFQSRDTFTLWGILQLLRRYPGKLPDLDLMFNCDDMPVIMSKDYSGPNATTPPPLFRYCGSDASVDVVFPDWSFWGWIEINIKPWESLLKDLTESNKRTRWVEREPHAYWKGNPSVAATRKDLMKCNVSKKHDWGARVYAQDWLRESQQGFKQSDLASECIHRYKIYIEGRAWSVSKKYILACNSVTLLVKSHYYDFFTRGLVPMHHYWPIKEDDKCKSIKFAVDWGNLHKTKAKAIGKAGSEFILEDTKMDYVYDYMFHLLHEYAKLMRFKPTIPSNAIEYCSETMACQAGGLEKNFMMETMVKGPAETNPCILPPPYDPPALSSLRTRNENSIKQVETWEKNYREHKKKQH